MCYSTSHPSRLHVHVHPVKASTRVTVCTSTTMKGLTRTPLFTKVCTMPSTLPITLECTSVRLTDANTVIIVHLPGISSSVAYHTCPLYVLDLPCYCVIPVVAQTITPLVAVVHEYTRNSVHVYDGEEPYSDPAVYESMYNSFHLTICPRMHM